MQYKPVCRRLYPMGANHWPDRLHHQTEQWSYPYPTVVWQLAYVSKPPKNGNVNFFIQNSQSDISPINLGTYGVKGSKNPQTFRHNIIGQYFLETHITNITTSASKKLNILKKMSFKLNRPILIQLYTTFVRPLLEYGNVLFDNQSIETNNMLDSVQYHAAVTCSGVYSTTSKRLLTEEIGWQSLSDRRKINKMILTFKIRQGIAPPYLRDIWSQLTGDVDDTSHYNLRNTQRLRVPFSRTERYKKSFFPSSISLWNKLPVNVINSKSLQSFKRNIASFWPPPCPPPPWFSAGSRLPNSLQTRLRLCNSSLNSDRFKIGLSDSASCQCGSPDEHRVHYILHCPLYMAPRLKCLKGIRDIIAPGVSPFTLPALSENHFITIVLKGSPDLKRDLNTQLFLIFQTFIIESGRFQTTWYSSLIQLSLSKTLQNPPPTFFCFLPILFP